jgi:hypothetical protein
MNPATAKIWIFEMVTTSRLDETRAEAHISIRGEGSQHTVKYTEPVPEPL